MVVEGLPRLVSNATSLGDFKGFRCSDNVSVKLLRFADNTVLVGDGSWHNLWSIKAFLRGFEFSSGMQVNLSMSKPIVYILECDFVQAATGFLSCGIGSHSFTFLGIPIGINLRCREVWKSVVDKIRRRLTVWHNRFLLIGSKVVLLNSVLANIPIFFSFYKASKVIVNEIIMLQRVFLWGGSEDKKRINWVWRFSVLQDQVFIAHDKVSLWWKDLRPVGKVEKDNQVNWFVSSITCRLGKGDVIDFWLHTWLGSVSLCFLFPSLFLVSNHHSYNVRECGFWLFGRWVWDIGIRADLLSKEDFVFLSQLYEILQAVQLDPWRDDYFIWWRNSGGFSISASYCRMVVVETG
ncbi:uncharacterized protein LOC127102743 [Lathyrus oleraceus]|uniref:uncharacterized protein LOC127102743 n=1 Tax=Pisum sativum TaxID=3888 RepID=UPI0021CEF3ED|nr:uncharacterized protein LOC127102743 [Pisum sativum]